MANLIKVTTPQVQVVGDNSSASLTLSLGEYPFPENPPGKVSNVTLYTHSFDGDSISFTSKTCTVTFEHAFSGELSLSFNVTYDPT